MKKKIFIIHTGGTIAMTEDQKTGAVAPRDYHPLLSETGRLSELAHVITEEPFHLPSPHITPVEMLQLRNLICDAIKTKKIDGVVITHGTDTLEETAYFLDLTIKTEIPIVVTGAMRSNNEIGSDGLYNLLASTRVAASDEAKEKGVLVVLNDEIHTAINATKTHTSNVSTFQSPQYGPIGIVTKRGIIFHHLPTKRAFFNIQDVSKRVALLKVHAGMDASLLYAIKDLKYDGVVIEAMGQGNMPPAVIPGLQALLDAKIPIVLVSRCFNGIAQDVYEYEGGGKNLKEMGIIFANGLNGQKARIKLLIALAKTTDLQTLDALFQQ
ncbi:asparaginase [Bacillus chungangensis]|uniref:asparaginase n=1 Tax=Bacillus chungangensis TaxID=587633 RepID=A0ABT9X066_9BACI|nr:asparaginase [Bacillus chungangensis]MDQ0178395.1 L-asparaginase [Bacillus chungangensis]